MNTKNINQLKDEVYQLGPWFHQVDLKNGLKTRDINPTPGPQPINHPMPRWQILKDALPENLQGMRVLDIGCADGFFSLELARRGANVKSVDAAGKRIDRLKWLTNYFNLNELIQPEVATLESLQDSNERFDFVFMIALLYHLKHPLLGLEIISKLTNKLYLESALHTNNDASYLYLKPSQDGVHSIPKWFPTEKCVIEMLKYVGFSNIEFLERPKFNRGIYIASR